MSTRFAYYGHHKCATTWMRGVIEKVCRYTGMTAHTFDNPSQFEGNLDGYLSEHPTDFFCYTNAKYELLGNVGKLPGFHMIRDPRDIIVSGYFSHKHSHPTDGWSELIEHRKRLNGAESEEAGLLHEIDFSEPWIRDIADWNYQADNILELKYEEFVANPYDTVLAAFEHLELIDAERSGLGYCTVQWFRALGIKLNSASRGRLPNLFAASHIPADELLRIVYANRFAKQAKGRKPGQEDVKSHYRSGRAGDWQKYFTPRVADAFSQRYPGLLETLGYEPDDSWTRWSS